MPFSIIGSTEDVKTLDGRVVKGREYIWGVAEGTWCSLTSIFPLRLLTCHLLRTTSRERESLRLQEAAVAVDPDTHAGPYLDE